MEQFTVHTGQEALDTKEALLNADAQRESLDNAAETAALQQQFDAISEGDEIAYHDANSALQQGFVVVKKNEAGKTLEIVDGETKGTPLEHGTVISIDQVVDHRA